MAAILLCLLFLHIVGIGTIDESMLFMSRISVREKHPLTAVWGPENGSCELTQRGSGGARTHASTRSFFLKMVCFSHSNNYSWLFQGKTSHWIIYRSYGRFFLTRILYVNSMLSSIALVLMMWGNHRHNKIAAIYQVSLSYLTITIALQTSIVSTFHIWGNQCRQKK